MLKEILIITIIFAIIIFADMGVMKYLEQSTDTLIKKADEVNLNIEDIQKSKQLVNELNKEWEKVKQIWPIIILHQELDQIEISLLSVMTAINDENLDDAKIELAKFEFLLKHLSEKEAFKLKNVF